MLYKNRKQYLTVEKLKRRHSLFSHEDKPYIYKIKQE